MYNQFILCTLYKKFFFSAPKHIIYDDACKDQLFLQSTKFYVDRFHWDNQTSRYCFDIDVFGMEFSSHSAKIYYENITIGP